MGNNVLPARAGEMLRVVLLSRRTDASKRDVLGTVVAERLLDAIALGSIFVVVVYGILRKTTLPSDRPLLVARPAGRCSPLGAASRSGCCGAAARSSGSATSCVRWPARRARC